MTKLIYDSDHSRIVINDITILMVVNITIIIDYSRKMINVYSGGKTMPSTSIYNLVDGANVKYFTQQSTIAEIKNKLIELSLI